MPSPSSGRIRPLLLLPALPALLGLLAGCGGSSSAGAAAGATSVAATSPPGSTGGSGSGTGTGSGTSTPKSTTGGLPVGSTPRCGSNGKSIPAGAGKASSPDLDHDGKRDTIWLADVGSTRRLGVKTASGDVFSTSFTSAAPQAANAIGQRLGDGSVIILLNTGRSVQLYAVIDCAIVPVKNLQGKQYTFDLGFTGYGTGVRCVNAGRGLEVAGMLATQKSGSMYTVDQTRIALSDQGREARNIQRQTLTTKASADSALVKSAQSVSCGTHNPGAAEPQS